MGRRIKEEPILVTEGVPGEIIKAMPSREHIPVDVTQTQLRKMARGYIMGTTKMRGTRRIKQRLEEKVTRRIGKEGVGIVDKLFDLINGVRLVTKDDGEVISYYTTPPSLPAIIYALDRVLGKPVIQSEHSEEKRGIILVEQVIKNLAESPNGQQQQPAPVSDADLKAIVEGTAREADKTTSGS